MSFKNLFKSLTTTSARRRPTRRPSSARLSLEALEDRSVPSYSVIDLGTLGGGGYSRAGDINASGQVVGESNSHAFLWQNGIMVDLGTLGGSYSTANGINDVGQIVGSAGTADGTGHAFLLTPEDTDGNGTPDRWFRDSNSDGKNDLMLDLGPYSVANDVNNAGQVVGNLWTGDQHAFWWQNGVTIDLGTLGGLSSYAAAINDAGQVTGTSDTSTGELSAFLWQGGAMYDIGPSTGASDVNQSGQVAGTGPLRLSAGEGSALTYYATLWTPTTPNGTTGAFTTLGALGPDQDINGHQSTYTYSFAASVNDIGTVVGSSRTIHRDDDAGFYYETSHGFVWADGAMEDLMWEGPGLQNATAINNAGQIVGNGPYSFTGETPTRAFLLTPESATTPLVYIGDVTVTEGNTGTRAATFTVTLSAASSQAVSVNYATADGSATAGSDYQAASGTLTIPAGQTTGTITVQVNGDRLVEPNETFVVNLRAPTNATIADGQGIGTILDDEPRISINDVTVTEGNTGTVNATFTVSLSVAYDVAVTVHYQTANGSATAGSDYAAASGNVGIAAGQSTKTFTVAVIGDRSAEPTENFVVNLSAATNGLIVDSQGVGTILDNEPRISISDVSKKEGKNNQTTQFIFTVTLSAAYGQPVTMSFRTVDGTAKTSDSDYVAKTGTLTFAPGETTKTITIEVTGDSKKEADETFYLDLVSNSTNSLVTKSRGIGTILNDD